jgi:hypothetical protein
MPLSTLDLDRPRRSPCGLFPVSVVGSMALAAAISLVACGQASDGAVGTDAGSDAPAMATSRASGEPPTRERASSAAEEGQSQRDERQGCVIGAGYPYYDGGCTEGQCAFWVGANTTTAEENQGVRAWIQVRDDVGQDGGKVISGYGGGDFSCWVSAYAAPSSAEAYDTYVWAQIGWKAESFGRSSPDESFVFYQAYNGNAPMYAQAGGSAALIDGMSHVSNGVHEFAMQYDPSTASTWNFSVDGQTIGSFDLGWAHAYYPEMLCEESDGVTQPYDPPNGVFVPVTMELYSAATETWRPLTTAVSYNSNCVAGIDGHDQNPALASNQVTVGGSVRYNADAGMNVPLWAGDAATIPDATATPLTPFEINIVNPPADGRVCGKVMVRADVSPPDVAEAPPESVQIIVDSNDGSYTLGSDGGLGSGGCTLTQPPYECLWDTTKFPNRGAWISAQVTKRGGVGYTEQDFNVSVDNGRCGCACPDGG